jgi:hypothetical protein
VQDESEWLVTDRFLKYAARADELTAIAQLLDHSDDLLGQIRSIDRDAHVLTPVLATGVEKLLKLTYGLLAAHESGSWPTSTEFRTRFGHKVHNLDVTCRQQLRGREGQAAARGVVSQAREALEADPWLSDLLGLLQSYADRGRFYNIDVLGDDTKATVSTTTLWNLMEQRRWNSWKSRLLSASTGVPGPDELAMRRRDEWRKSIRRWRWFYYQCWVQGMCGPEARQCASEIRGPEPQ